MRLNEAYAKAVEEVLNQPSIKNDVNCAFLALHESATKLWQAVVTGQKEKICSRAASSLVSVFYVMHELGIENPEECLAQKLAELKDEKSLEGA